MDGVGPEFVKYEAGRYVRLFSKWAFLIVWLITLNMGKVLLVRVGSLRHLDHM